VAWLLVQLAALGPSPTPSHIPALHAETFPSSRGALRCFVLIAATLGPAIITPLK
jgi:hypothetical protein